MDEEYGGGDIMEAHIYYPWNLIIDAYEKVEQGAKRLDYEDERYKITVYRTGTIVRIDVAQIKEVR